jgi:D-alanine-D-alanine ligase
MKKKTIALVTGGYSAEAAISYKSAITISNNLDRALFDVYKIDINPAGWYHEEGGVKTAVDKNNFTLEVHGQHIIFDAVFMGMHGTPGEDGKLPGYFDILGLPYTSCDAATSALTFNKRYTVAVAAMAGINVAKSMHLFKHIPYQPENILSTLQLPIFIKPNNGGSSIGMSKVNDGEELQAALDKAFKEDDQVLAEEMIEGREFTVGVCRFNGQIKILPITEVITQNDFFDFEAKYEGKSSEITPAVIDPSWKIEIEAAAKKVYNVFNCRGVVRIDFIYSTAYNAPFMLEINTVPGQSDASVIPQQVKVLGMELKEFYTMLLEEALADKAKAI